MVRAFCLAGVVALFPGIAVAQWQHTESGGAFDGAPMNVAGITATGYMFGLRCEDAASLEVVYITPETVTHDEATRATRLAPRVMVRVDDGPVIEVDAVADAVNGRLGFAGSPDPSLADQIAGAGQRISVAVSFLGQIIHESAFSARGSTAAVGALSENCGI